MPDGLSRRLRYAFVLQAILASAAIMVGSYVVGMLVKDKLTDQRIHEVAQSIWRIRERSPDASLPQLPFVAAYYVPKGGDTRSLPSEFRSLKPGVTQLGAISSRKVWVEKRASGTLYVLMTFSTIDKIVFWVGLTSMILALLILYGVTGLTYYRSRRLVAPVDRLARQVSHWRPEDLQTDDIVTDQLLHHPIREVRQLSGALRSLGVKLRDFVQRERNFTRDASHELRTPLTVIRVATDLMLNDAELPPRTRNTLDRVQRAGRDMETIIDAFLILAREENVAPQSEEFEIHEIVLHEVSKIASRLDEKGVALRVVENAAPRLHSSPHAFAVVVGNLLNNACAFTERGVIEVSIKQDRVVIDDSGIGMSEETLRKASDPFYRADQFSPTGKGMGLTIVHRLCQRFGWRIELSSTPDIGTKAIVHFQSDSTATSA